MSRRHEFEIRHGLSPALRGEAAAIIYDAFEAKLRPFLPSRESALALIHDLIRPEALIAALRRGTLVGVCGLSRRGEGFLRLRPGPFLHHLGILRGIPRFLGSLVLGKRLPRGELLIKSLAVREDMRGRGIGTQLLEAAYEYAQANGFSVLRLEVVDTNPGAQRLYARLGFQVAGTRRYPLTRRLMGFSTVIAMTRAVAP